MIAVLLLGCGGESSDDSAAADEVTWGGFVYVGSGTEKDDRFSTGTITLWEEPFEESGAEVAMEQPYYDNYPGFWQVVAPPQRSVNLRISNEGWEAPDSGSDSGAADTGTVPMVEVRSTVWAGNTPRADGNWLGGALFAATDDWIEALFEAVGEDGDVYVTAVDEPWVRVIGAPADAGWDCAELQIAGRGVGVSPDAGGVQCWGEATPAVAGIDATYAPISTGQPVLFTALVEPGAFTVSHGIATEHYVADAGDIVVAFNFVGNP
jgi:hypothetical protein